MANKTGALLGIIAGLTAAAFVVLRPKGVAADAPPKLRVVSKQLDRHYDVVPREQLVFGIVLVNAGGTVGIGRLTLLTDGYPLVNGPGVRIRPGAVETLALLFETPWPLDLNHPAHYMKLILYDISSGVPVQLQDYGFTITVI